MAEGGTSLDTWVRTDGAVDTRSLLPQRLTLVDLAARRPAVVSRSAENLFWLGRYTERTEHSVRLARAVMRRIDSDDELPPNLLAALSRLAELQGRWPTAVCSALARRCPVRRKRGPRCSA